MGFQHCLEKNLAPLLWSILSSMYEGCLIPSLFSSNLYFLIIPLFQLVICFLLHCNNTNDKNILIFPPPCLQPGDICRYIICFLSHYSGYIFRIITSSWRIHTPTGSHTFLPQAFILAIIPFFINFTSLLDHSY